tara:strand:+ start:80 stop:1252 length:1173 start_codon:yes stop_codon:yes gene_type:complete
MSAQILPEIQKISKKIISTRRKIHQNPELAFNEFETSKLIAKRLKSLNIKFETAIGKTGIVATISGSNNKKTIALRADMDALPIQETSKIPYKSKNDGIMHACGHDGHVAILLGVAEILSQYKKDDLKGNIKLIFQPAEEGHHGAKYMIKDGALKGVNEIYGLHLWNYQDCGTIGAKSGPIMAAADIFTIKIYGKGGHGATPQGTKDSIIIASHIIQALQTIVSRNTNPLESTVVSVGQINGGYNFNIIADQVTLKGTTRSYTIENRKLIKKRMKEIIVGFEKSFKSKIELIYDDGYPPTINNESCTQKLLVSAKKIVGNKAGNPYLSMGGEDFSYYLEKIPGCYFFVGSSPQGKKALSVPHHCSHFDIDEKALLIGASVYIQLIKDLLT